MISSLEALAVMVALKIFCPSGSPDSRRKVDLIPTWTDNRGNGSALNKLMSARFPASALLPGTRFSHERGANKGKCSLGSERDELRTGPPSKRELRGLFSRVSYPYRFLFYVVVLTGRSVIYGSRC